MQVTANGISLEFDDQGPRHGPPLLLVMGLGMQLIAWPEELVAELVQRGFRVIRFDNRDVGLSQQFDALGVPSIPLAALRYALRLPVRSPYRLADMARDAVGLLDALDIEAAHVCGASMGGMIAQHMAASHSARVRSLTLLMTSSGARSLPKPSTAVRRAMLARPKGEGIDAVAAQLGNVLNLIGSPAYRPDPQVLHERLRAAISRSHHPAGTARQLVAVVADGDRSALLRHIVAPTRIVHGQDDTLIPVAAAHDLLRKVPDAVADLVPGMGHDLPLPLMPRLADGIAENAARAGVTA